MKRKRAKTDSVLSLEERAAILKMLEDMPLPEESPGRKRRHTQTYPRDIEPRRRRPTKPMFRR